MRKGPGRSSTARGFTIVELLIVMGMLGMFLVFLTQLLSDSLRLWQRGEERASLEARAAMALALLSDDFERVNAVSDRQWAPGREARFGRLERSGRNPPRAGRLYAHWTAFKGARPADPDVAFETPAAVDWYPELRMVVTLDPSEGDFLHRERVRREVEDEEGELPPDQLAERMQERLAELPVRAPAEVVLRILPTGEEDGCYLSLHRDVQLLDGSVQKRWVDLASLPLPSPPLISNLLYAEFLFRSQNTERWETPPGRAGGPERCWDSARAGTFPLEHDVLYFGGDLDADSLGDPLDDVMPSWVQVRVTVDEGPGVAYTALLGKGLEVGTQDIQVEPADRLPPADEQPYLKIGGEWIRYTSRSGARLLGVRRGQRHTKAREHRAGARIHAGREAMVRVPISVAREYWNDQR